MDMITKLLSGAFTKEEMLSWPAWRFAEVVEDYSALEKLLDGGIVSCSQLELTEIRLDTPHTARYIMRALCQAGHMKLLGMVLQNRPQLVTEVVDDALSTPLHVASRHGLSAAVRMLLRSGSQVNPRDDDGWTPLQLAANMGSVDTVRVLLEAGADHRGRNALLWSAEQGRSRAVTTLVAAGADVHVRDKDRCTPLHWAAECCDVEAVSALLEAGAKRNSLDKDNRTPVHWAAQGGNASVLRILLRGAKVYLKDRGGWTPLHYAAWHTDSEETARELRAAGANTTARDEEGRTPLHLAAERGHANMARLLLETTDVDVTDDYGWTPLQSAAAYKDSVETAEELLEAGADISVRESCGKTLLHLAAERGRIKMVRLLLEEIDVDVTDGDDLTPLHLAVRGGHSSVITELLQAGADPTAPDCRWRTPLHVAAEQGRVNVVQHLVHHTDVDVTDYEDWTPLLLAASGGHSSVVCALVLAGADKMARNVYGQDMYDLLPEN